MSALVLTIRKFNDNKGRVRFDWNLRSNGQIVSTSHRQGYSRRIDCANGAEVGAGLVDVHVAITDPRTAAARWTVDGLGYHRCQVVNVRLVDERGQR